MTPEGKSISDSATAALGRDLALVAARLAAGGGSSKPGATTSSPEAAWTLNANDVAAVATAIGQSQAPAIVGLNSLSIEACRHVVPAAEAMRGRLLPWPLSGDAALDQFSVMQTGSLGHLFSSDLIVWVGCHGGDGPIAQAIAAHQLLAAMVPADPATILNLRQTLAKDPQAAPIGSHRRVGVVLGPAIDPRVSSQWHKLAAQLQNSTRVAVFTLPDLTSAGNRRGALEVITWQTGQSCRTGGVDFGSGAPRPCTDAQTLLNRSAIDLLIDTTLPDLLPAGALKGKVIHRIVLGPDVGPGPESERLQHIVIPSLQLGMAARVMRCDGMILWTCVDSAQAQPDPAAVFFEALNLNLRSSL